MPFEKNNNLGAGRPKGSLNKDNKLIKDAFRRLLEDNLDNMTEWLASIAKDNPAKAIDLALRMGEYFIPKLARTEIVGNDGKDLFNNIEFKFNIAEKKDAKE